jgi:membrane associated rhomboid family serine protease
MIPLRDVIPSRTRPIATTAIILVNAFVFLYEASLPEPALRLLLSQYGLVPAHLALPTFVTSMFLHGGWLHVIGNMWSLWIFGDNVEDRMGHGRFIVFYLLCGLLAAMGQVMVDPSSRIPTVGASGAIAGVMGAYLVLYPHSRILTLVPLFVFLEVIEIPAVYFLGFWFVIQFFSGVGSLARSSGAPVGGVAFWAHVAGFVAGVIGVFLFRRRERARVEWWHDREAR